MNRVKKDRKVSDEKKKKRKAKIREDNMKKAAIITLYGNYNYGNKLQNYALQEVLKRENLEVETLNTTRHLIHRTNKDAYVRLGFKLLGINIYRNIMKFFNSNYVLYKEPNLTEIEKKRIKNIEVFDKLIVKSDIIPIRKNLKQINKKYDYFIMGSDQIWNPFYTKSYDLNLGMFADKEKKISYAASFGVSGIYKRARAVYKKGLKDMNQNKISVREFQGEKIVKELIGTNVTTVLDPTMLLSKEDWMKLTKEPKTKPKKKYLLTYILGDNLPERREFINQIAKRDNLEVVNLHDESDKERAIIGVEEFLCYFENAEIIFADSFHAGVFSILFEKPFYILRRASKSQNIMHSRFETLLQTFNLEDRLLTEYNINKVNYDIDYKKINKTLEERRKISIDFLKGTLLEEK